MSWKRKPQNTSKSATNLILSMAPGPKKAAIIKRMASLAMAGAKRAAEKLSPRKKKKRKIDSDGIEPDSDANKENLSDVSVPVVSDWFKQYL